MYKTQKEKKINYVWTLFDVFYYFVIAMFGLGRSRSCGTNALTLMALPVLGPGLLAGIVTGGTFATVMVLFSLSFYSLYYLSKMSWNYWKHNEIISPEKLTYLPYLHVFKKNRNAHSKTNFAVKVGKYFQYRCVRFEILSYLPTK